jgi:pimeloyl-ACP methyl ester carboxylesterase
MAMNTSIPLTYYPYRSAKAKEEYLAAYDQTAKEWPIPANSRLVPTSFGATFVRIGGPPDGQPLILLPGMGATSLLWQPNIEAFSKTYRTYAVDNMADVGRSVCTRPIRDSAGLVSWLDELTGALKLADGFHLLGLSHGGWVATQYALRFPKRLGKLVLLAPAASVLRTQMEFYIRGLLLLTGNRSLAKACVFWLMHDLVRVNRARAETAIDRAMLTFRCLQARRVITPTVLRDREWQSLSMPVLFLVGENEKIYSAGKAWQRLHAVAPQIQAQIIPGAGHDLTLAQPEMVNRKVLEFLAG